jgi:hypothetical protein
MKVIIGYIKEYFYETHKGVLIFATFLTGFLIFLNYYTGLDGWISHRNSFIASFLGRAAIFFTAFALPYLAYHLFTGRPFFSDLKFLLFLFIAPLIFSFKIAFNPAFHYSDNLDFNIFWNHVFYWPALCLVTTTMLFFIWKVTDSSQPFYGIRTRGMNWKPYALMLLIMVPLVTAASTQADFLAMYPKLKLLTENDIIAHLSNWQKVLFELSYGTDFITIELFFRGFLVLAFIRWAGKDAILPMACFYCTIHFGKPLGECISSYFGGMLLGIVVYNTRSILGGLMVHLGIAWMMELGGYIGNSMSH